MNSVKSQTHTCCCHMEKGNKTKIASGSYVSVYMLRNNDGDYRIYGVADDDTDAEKINFCPFCGRDLR